MSFLRNIFKNTRLADRLACAGLIFWVVALWQVADRQASVLDEGLYLYKGWLLVSGRYFPFQDYGLWMNQMPLAFLIPGWGQVLLGAGLLSGRTLAVILAISMLLALWRLTRRVGNPWLGALAVWAMVINPAAARMYGVAASQGLAAALLVFILLLSVHPQPKNSQLFAAGLLAGVLVMVRINLLPLLPLLFLYLLWVHGWKPALSSLGGMLITFGGVNLVYWPNILRLWLRWVPLQELIPDLAALAPPPNIRTVLSDLGTGYQITSLFLAFRYYFFGLVGFVLACMLWPKNWQSNWQKKTAIFLSALFLIYFVLHAWASFGNDYCTFCFPTYTSFYISLAIIFFSLIAPSFNWQLSAMRAIASLTIFLALMAGIGYTAVDAFVLIFGNNFYKNMLAWPLPRFRDGGIVEGQAQIWQIFGNRFGWAYESQLNWLWLYFPLIAFVAVGLFIFITSWLLFRKDSRRAAFGLLAIFVVGNLLAPTELLSADFKAYDCQPRAMQQVEKVGQQLAGVIPAGVQVYWWAYSPTPLLYLPNIKIYPAQLNGSYSLRIGEDTDALQKYGWWNEELNQQWLREADYLIVDQAELDGNSGLFNLLKSPAYERLLVTDPPNACQPNSALNIFRRK